MRCVHRTSDRTVAQLLRGALESEGVPSFVQGEHLTALAGQLPVGASAEYRVCIIDNDQLPRAEVLARQWLSEAPTVDPDSVWTCRACGETHEPLFRSCWRCGADAEDA